MKDVVGDIGKPGDLPGELDEASNRIIGAAIEVHRHLGPGLLESIYERALGTNCDCEACRSGSRLLSR
jgi:hypothetical protein